MPVINNAKEIDIAIIETMNKYAKQKNQKYFEELKKIKEQLEEKNPLIKPIEEDFVKEITPAKNQVKKKSKSSAGWGSKMFG
jgi:hypothetical protein